MIFPHFTRDEVCSNDTFYFTILKICGPLQDDFAALDRTGDSSSRALEKKYFRALPVDFRHVINILVKILRCFDFIVLAVNRQLHINREFHKILARAVAAHKQFVQIPIHIISPRR